MSLRLIRNLFPAVSLAAFIAACGTPSPNGGSCTLRRDDGGTGATITCADGTSVHLANGANGTNGTNGTNGANGTNGTNGTDGVPCSVAVDDAGTRTITCADGTSVTLSNGTDANCTVTTDLDSGVSTIRCSDGTVATVTNGHNGTNGTNGTNGINGGNVRVTDFHGASYLMSSGEYANGAKILAHASITTATADTAGVVTVNFRVETAAHVAITNVPSITANISKLLPAVAGEASNHWVPYIYRTETVTAGPWPAPAGTSAIQAYRESTGTLTNHHDGTYTYVFSTNLSTAMMGTTPITYERNRTHRVVIMMGGHSGPTADAFLDFVPDGSAVTETRNIVETSSCQSCHDANQFHGHGGDRLSIETCASCHVQGSIDANSGESLELRNMIHKIHAGGELASIPGADGILYDNPATPANEAADNGHYTIYGFNNTPVSWADVEFPAVLANCTKCHQGTGAQVDNWMNRPSRAACGSCHDTTNFVTGTNHGGGAQTDDSACATCHHPTGGLAPIVTGHNWTVGDPRNVPEFTPTVTVSAPANGMYFVRGEAPVVSIALRDAVTGTLLDHTAINEDPAGESCLAPPGACAPRDGLFRGATLFVDGPRARRMPVLTTSARAQIFSSSVGPFDISAAGATLALQLDQGADIHSTDSVGGDTILTGTVTVPVSSGTFVSRAAATPTEIATWLNANAAFAARAIAWVDTATGKVALRSRNLGTVFSLQLQTSAVATAVFAGDVTAHMPPGFTTGNTVSRRIVPANNDPKVSYTAGAILYQLDPVDDLAPGTYMASIEFSDHGRTDDTNYVTPTVAVVTFQVGVATVERAPAGNCASCHEGPDGRGFVLDYPRHNKIFNNSAIDQCGSCHDYQPQAATGVVFPGAVPISRRVHAVHAAASMLNYPITTVSHADTVPGRNWNLPFPQDLRNCESCHPSATTSGTWATRPNRLACGGCHDSDAATSHMRIQTFDPSPANPWSGDETESCQTCH